MVTRTYGKSRAEFVLDEIEYFAVRGPKEIVLITRGRITQDQYDEAYEFAKGLFDAMDRCLKWSMRDGSSRRHLLLCL